MAINCFLTLNGTSFYPELPIGRRKLLVREQKRMKSGQLRTAQYAEKYAFSLRLTDATEAERSAWLAAAATSASISFTDELAVVRTVVVQDVVDDLTRTEPAAPGGLATTGPGYYDLSIELEEV